MAFTFRVYKKSSPNGKITLYLARRDIIDHVTSVDPIDGVVVVEDEYLKNRKVFGQVIATFRYGSEDDEVMGLHFFKELYLCSEQIYPMSLDKQPVPSKLQERMIKKLGPNTIPFLFQLPNNAPQSVILQPSLDDVGQPCGVYYEVKTFVGQTMEDNSHKRSTIRMGIRKIQWAPIAPSRQPCSVIRKDFLLSPGELELEVTLDRQVYHHGEQIAVNISIQNNSNKTVKRIRVSAVQNIDICMFASGHCKVTIASIDTDKGCPINPGASIQKVVVLSPETYYHHKGVALEGNIKSEENKLASSTLLLEKDQHDSFGIIVSYSVKVKLYLGAFGGDIVAELPFILMRHHPGKVKEITDMGLETAQHKSSREGTVDGNGQYTSNPIFQEFSKKSLDQEPVN